MSNKNKKNSIKFLKKLFPDESTFIRFIADLNQNTTQSQNTDYVIAAENAGKQADAKRYVQETANLRQLIGELHLNQRKTQKELKSLNDLLHSSQKVHKDQEREIQQLLAKIENFSKRIDKLEKRNGKFKKNMKKISGQIAQIKHIIACISFLFGTSSMSDGMNEISRNWNKLTKRNCKQHPYLKPDVIEAKWKEVK